MRTYRVYLEPIVVRLDDEDVEGMTDEQIEELVVEVALDHGQPVQYEKVEEIKES